MKIETQNDDIEIYLEQETLIMEGITTCGFEFTEFFLEFSRSQASEVSSILKAWAETGELPAVKE